MGDAIRKLIEAVEAGRDDSEKWHPALGEHGYTAMMAFHGSLDAAKALHDALLPGWAVTNMCQLWDVSPGGEFTGIGKDWGVELQEGAGDSMGRAESATSSDPARAWLLAILSAMAPRGEHG